MANAVVHFEIPVTDLDRAKKFYETMMDVEMTFIDMGTEQMYMFPADEGYGSGGAILKSADAKPSMDGTTVYLGCADVATNAAKVEAAGGQVIVPKTSIGEHGFFALIIDTEGNKVGLHSDK